MKIQQLAKYLALICIFIVSCKTTMVLKQNTNVATKSHTVSNDMNDSTCQKFNQHISMFWSYNKMAKIYTYTGAGLNRYVSCLTDTTKTINMLGKPSAMYNGFMFYYMNCHCFEEEREFCYKNCNCPLRTSDECDYWKVKYNDNGTISAITHETVHFVQ